LGELFEKQPISESDWRSTISYVKRTWRSAACPTLPVFIEGYNESRKRADRSGGKLQPTDCAWCRGHGLVYLERDGYRDALFCVCGNAPGGTQKEKAANWRNLGRDEQRQCVDYRGRKIMEPLDSNPLTAEEKQSLMQRAIIGTSRMRPESKRGGDAVPVGSLV